MQNCDAALKGGIFEITKYDSRSSLETNYYQFIYNLTKEEARRITDQGFSIVIPIEGVPVGLEYAFNDDQWNYFYSQTRKITQESIKRSEAVSYYLTRANIDILKEWNKCIAKNSAGFDGDNWRELDNGLIVATVAWRPHPPQQSEFLALKDVGEHNCKLLGAKPEGLEPHANPREFTFQVTASGPGDPVVAFLEFDHGYTTQHIRSFKKPPVKKSRVRCLLVSSNLRNGHPQNLGEGSGCPDGTSYQVILALNGTRFMSPGLRTKWNGTDQFPAEIELDADKGVTVEVIFYSTELGWIGKYMDSYPVGSIYRSVSDLSGEPVRQMFDISIPNPAIKYKYPFLVGNMSIELSLVGEEKWVVEEEPE